MENEEVVVARRALGFVTKAVVAGDIDQEVVNWVSSKAYEVFLREARKKAERQLAEEKALRRTRKI